MSQQPNPAAAAASLVVPFSVFVDTREQRPYTFQNLKADADRGRRPLEVPVYSATLTAGDYSINGLCHVVAVERKSKEDLFGTLGGSRERFERELVRLQQLEHAYVVVEAELGEIFTRPPARSSLLSKTVFRSVLAWQVRYPRVHWLFCPGRNFAEAATFRILERVWKDKQCKS